MKHLLLLLLIELFLLGAQSAFAQPGGDDSRFSALETCNEHYLEKEYVFVGRIVSVDEIPYIPNVNTGARWKAVVAVETSLKGSLSGEIEVTIVKDPFARDLQIENERAIFTADRISNSEFSGLFTIYWSTPLDKFPPDVIANVLNGIRAVLRGIPQPRIVGTVREQSWGISFDPAAGKALPGIVVVAESKDGRKFEAQTDAEGRFQFDELPTGMYTVSPILPKKMDLYAKGFTHLEGEKKYIRIDSWMCSRKLYFVAQKSASVIRRIERETGNWASGKPLLYLHRVDPKSGKIDPTAARKVPSQLSVSENTIRFSFDHVPVGSYVLSIDNIEPEGKSATIYYPGVRNSDHAQVINVAVDKPTEVIIKLSSLQ
jgi:hypothetical protein